MIELEVFISNEDARKLVEHLISAAKEKGNIHLIVAGEKPVGASIKVQVYDDLGNQMKWEKEVEVFIASLTT